MKNYVEDSPLFGSNAAFIEQLYQQYSQDRNSVDVSWQKTFDELGDSFDAIFKNRHGASWAPKTNTVIGAAAEEASNQNERAGQGPKQSLSAAQLEQDCNDSINALMLIRAFKVRGHLLSDLDPLGLEGHRMNADLDPATYGFAAEDANRKIFLGGALGLQYATVPEIVAILKQTYSGTVGVEFMHIADLEQRDWISSRMEEVRGHPRLTAEEKKKILLDIIQVQYFEEYLHVKYPGAKRFSVEGGEAAIASMEKVIEFGSELGIEEIVIGMPHRGRLNVITKVMGRSYASIMTEFQGNMGSFPEEMDVSGDVKYHLGTSDDREFNGKSVHLSLTANPSHLEAVNPVVVGKVRAKQKQRKDVERSKVMGILFHGDAAFAGQGVVAETLALSDLEGYTTGGTFHIIINNQIGFTTSPHNARKSPYPSDVAKMVSAPIFHVNGDDPEAVIFVTKLAVEFRQRFKKDVVLDIICYRRHGHNEGDEPSFTQPVMYDAIRKHVTPMEAYYAKLKADGVVSEADYNKMVDDFKNFLDAELAKSQNYKADKADWLSGKWEGFENPGRGEKPSVDTGVDSKTLKKIGEALATYPEGFNINKKLVRLMEAKREMMQTGQNLDWAMGEALAYGSLIAEGHDVRLSGQDCMRGTFSHRHSGLVDQVTGEKYYPLNNLGLKNQATYEVIDSNLSEYGVMGFEYGYSLADPNGLVLWEGQFGDFCNGAQIIIDQFLCSGEIKWLRMCGLVLLLPHGYEGQGPEHSSARLERFLQLCAEDNMQVVNCSTPANFFHALRRQQHRNFRKPLIVMSPKSLLRHKLCVSDLKDFDKGTSFKLIIPETEKLVADNKVRRVVLCSGKIYYELLENRNEQKINDIAIVRLEQYYPFPMKELVEELKRYKNAEFIWCQEEHKNMGAWHYVAAPYEQALINAKVKQSRPKYVGRKAAAAASAGYMKIHNREQQALVKHAFDKSEIKLELI